MFLSSYSNIKKLYWCFILDNNYTSISTEM